MIEAGCLASYENMYLLMADALNYPDRDLVDKVAGGEFGEELRECLASVGAGRPENGLSRLRLKAEETPDEFLLSLEKDYTRMCFTSKPRLVPLFESVYREGKLLQESTFEIARLYYDAGLKPAETFSLPPDHIAVELEFMAYLCRQERESHARGKAEKRELASHLKASVMNGHLKSFALQFSKKMKEHARTPFYSAIGDVMEQFFSLPAA